jgi:hypothetical protein
VSAAVLRAEFGDEHQVKHRPPRPCQLITGTADPSVGWAVPAMRGTPSPKNL